METTKNKIKNCIICIFSASILALSGCSGKETQDLGNKTQYINLNLENAEIIENIPASGEWHSLKYAFDNITESSLDLLQKAAGNFGCSPSESEVLCNVRYSIDGKEKFVDYTFDELAATDLPKTEYLRYVGEDFYIAYNLSNRFELYNRKALREINGEQYESQWEWKPGHTGEKFGETYDLSQNRNPPAVLTSAIAFAESELNSGKLSPITSELFAYTPMSAEILTLSNGANAYEIYFVLNYDGVPMDSSRTAANSNLERNDIFANKLSLCMFSDKSIDWLWSPAITFDKSTSQEECTISIDFGKACEIVSEALSKEAMFEIDKVELLYYTRAIYSSGSTEYIVEPSWQFSFASGVQEYGKLCVNVNAVTGEMNMRQFV